ncbi:response regulator transcription factor [Amphibacillus sp. Q70]|uniref:response regulator transcription factor n=1 Tax=Amphibacillus sp. Q70 TaxID=3453416 RepID=UPI003F85B07A
MKRILLVEDSIETSKMLHTILSKDYQITQAFSGTEGLLLFQQQSFDLIILDRMLPGKSGQEVLEEVRQTSQIPIIILTAISNQNDIAELLLKGANDYLTKPFNNNELKARIVVQLRTHSHEEKITTTDILQYKNLTLYPDSFEIGNKKGARLPLKRKEFDILALLIQHPDKVYTKEQLYELIWGESYYGDENTINVHISNVRKKIKQLDDKNQYITTVWGIGIKLS